MDIADVGVGGGQDAHDGAERLVLGSAGVAKGNSHGREVVQQAGVDPDAVGLGVAGAGVARSLSSTCRVSVSFWVTSLPV